MTREEFLNKFEDLDLSLKMQLYNEYALKKDDPDIPTFHYIDEQFFIDHFISYLSLAEKIAKSGGIDMDNNIIYFDSWNDLVTISDDDAEENIDKFAEDIYTYPDIWKYYIKED